MEPTNSVEPTPPKQNSSATTVIVVLVILIIAALLWWRNDAGKKAADENKASAPAAQETPPASTDGQQTVPPGEPFPTGQVPVKSFTVEGTPFAFSLNEIRVNQGDKVKITFVNKEGLHDFVLDEFGVKTQRIGAGLSETVEFTADKKGTFEYYCSVGQHRQQGMKGNFIVQ